MNTQQPELLPFANPDAIELPPAPDLTENSLLSDAMGPFHEHMRRRQFAPNTIRAFANDLKLLSECLGERARLTACSQQRLEQFLHYLRYERKAPCSRKSLDRRITTLKVFFGWLSRYEIIASDPAAGLVHASRTRPLPEVLSENEVNALLSASSGMREASMEPDARPHLLLVLLLATGIKKAECMRLALHDIDLSDPTQPTVYVRYERPRQRAKSRRLAVPGEWRSVLQEYITRYQPREMLFECTPRNLEYVLHTISVVAGLARPATFEMLRWTCALRALRKGVEPDRIRQRLGLSKITWRETEQILHVLASAAD